MDWNKTLVVSNFIHPFYKNIAFLRDLYRFPHVRVYGDDKFPAPPDVIPFNQSDGAADRMKALGGGFYAYRSMMHAVRENPDFEGYLFLMDDVLLSRARFARLDSNTLYASRQPQSACDVLQPTADQMASWMWWENPMCLEATKKALPHFSSKQLDNLAAMTGKRSVFWGGQNDCFYLPKTKVSEFLAVFEIMSEHRVFTEVAITSGLAMIAGPYEEIHLHYALPGRKTWVTAMLNPRCRGVHPVKFSTPKQRAVSRGLKMLGFV